MTGLTEKLLAAFARFNWLLQWLILSLLALLLYAPVPGNYFVNDDFLVLRKVCLDGQLNTDGFFRPLSDISIYANYIFSGFSPTAYRITSEVIHAFNALLLFHFCKRWQWAGDERLRQAFAAMATIFFITYPFHNEPVVWLLGRASLLASTFAMLALVIVTTKWREAWKMPLAAACYFIAMTGYESVFVLPAIVFIWLLANAVPFKKIIAWMGVFALVLIAHFIIRILVAGSATGEYGERLLTWDIVKSFSRAAKSAARLLAAPVDNPVGFSLLAAFLGLVVFAAIVKVWKRSAEKSYVRVQLLAWLSMLVLAMVIPFMFGVSTNSSESDRLLYFPSFFLCPLLAFLLLHLLYKKSFLPWLIGGILVYNIIFLELNNRNWQKASEAAASLLNIIRENPVKGKLYIVNLPDELDGAYIFRVGFRDALIVNRLDTAMVEVVNHAKMRELNKLPAIKHQNTNGLVFIPPGFYIQRRELPPKPIENKYRSIFVTGADKIIYWNRKGWVVLESML